VVDDQLYAFAFRGLLAEQALDLTARQPRMGASALLDQAVGKSVAIDLIDEQYVNRARRMAVAYAAIAALENSVRDFVAKKLLESKGEGWWTLCVSEKIRNKAESRKAEEDKIRWHTPRGEQLLNYTEFGDLGAIISQNWDLFEAHLRNQDWVKHVIGTLERSRNVIMHSGELANSDLERIGSVIRDWIRQAGA